MELVGWTSSLVLVFTLGSQVRKQWRSGNSQGVSVWLFVGQTVASAGFSIYSLLLGNWVFLATNLVLLGNALLGQWVTWHHSRRHAARSSQQQYGE